LIEQSQRALGAEAAGVLAAGKGLDYAKAVQRAAELLKRSAAASGPTQ
jgi:hypothetical protein